jgi:hypothetical protein
VVVVVVVVAPLLLAMCESSLSLSVAASNLQKKERKVRKNKPDMALPLFHCPASL